mgnify:CR=1 FL=1
MLADDKPKLPIGVEISADVVDLLADDEDVEMDGISEDKGKPLLPAA